MPNPFPIEITDASGIERLAGTATFTDPGNQPGGTATELRGADGGGNRGGFAQALAGDAGGGGGVQITGGEGDTAAAPGGNLDIHAGANDDGTGPGGVVEIAGGSGNDGGTVTILGGTGGGAASSGGDVVIAAGNGDARGQVELRDSDNVTQIQVGPSPNRIAFYGASPIAQGEITGALSTVADAPAKAVLTSIIAALVDVGLVTDGTT